VIKCIKHCTRLTASCTSAPTTSKTISNQLYGVRVCLGCMCIVCDEALVNLCVSEREERESERECMCVCVCVCVCVCLTSPVQKECNLNPNHLYFECTRLFF